MTTPRNTAAVVALISLFCSSKCFGYDDEITHRALTQVAAAKENSRLARFLMEELLLENGLDHRLPSENGVDGNPPTVTSWLRYGAMKEDHPLCRASNHFHNPLKPWDKSYVNDLPWYIQAVCSFGNADDYYPYENRKSAVTWATGYDAPGHLGPTTGNAWSWSQARDYYEQALTAGTTAEREVAYAKMFRSLGQVLHLLQDMSVPAHVRSDFMSHMIFPPDGEEWGMGAQLPWRIEPYEYYMQERFNDQTIPGYLSTGEWKPVRPVFGNDLSLTSFWDRNVYGEGTCPAGSRQMGKDLGLAEYTNANFLSQNTVFTENLSCANNYWFPHPRLSETNFFDGLPHIVPREAEDGTTDQLEAITITDRSGLDIWENPERVIATMKYTAQYLALTDPENWARTYEVKLFLNYWDDVIFMESAKRLIPRAVGYSASLLDYFFRGKLDVVAIEIVPGAYGITVTNTSGEKMDGGRIEIYQDSGDEGGGGENLLQRIAWTAEPVTLESGQGYYFDAVGVTRPTGKELTDVILTAVYRGKLGNENENAVAARRFMLDPTTLKKAMDLAIVLQPYSPYYNLVGDYVGRYRTALKKLFTALEGGPVDPGDIWIQSSGRRTLSSASGAASNDLPEQHCSSYAEALEFVGKDLSKPAEWPVPEESTAGKWDANLLEMGLDSARVKLSLSGQNPDHFGRGLIFTNWYQYDPQRTPPASAPPAAGTSDRWVTPFETAVGQFKATSRLDAVDVFKGESDGYVAFVGNGSWMEARFPLELRRYFSTEVADPPGAGDWTQQRNGHLVLMKPEDEGMSGAEMKLLFPWINEAAAAQMLVQAGESQLVEIPVDATMSRLSIGVTASIAGTETTLLRPDGTVVPVTQAGDTWVTDDPQIEYVKGSDYYLIRSPEPGTWRVRVRGASLSGSAQVRVHSYTDSRYRVDEQVPGEVRPGEPIAVSVDVGGHGDLLSPTTRMEFRRLRGSVYEIGSRVSVAALDKVGGLGSGRYTGQHTVSGYEGPLEYRVILDGRDGAGHAVHRESDGAIFVRGSPPQIVPLGPYAVTSDPFPLIQARITDDAALKRYTVRIDGRTLAVTLDAATGIASARPGTALAFGEHTVEVTAADQIDQEATPEIWTFRVGPGLLAADPAGDDRGPGYYGYPTDAAKYPANSFDLRTFRVGQSAGAVEEMVSFTVGLGALATTVWNVNQVVDVYLDTDGIAGSGRPDLLPGRNVTLRAEDAWEYVVTLTGEEAVLRDAAGTQWPLALDIQSGAKMLTAYVPFARLGIGDPAALASFGYTVLVLGRDGLNNGGVREVSTLGGANSFSGGAEGSTDPNVIDLLSPVGTTQEALLAGYSVAEGRRAVIAAYRFGGGIAADETAPMLTELAPAGAWDVDPPVFACRVRDDREVDVGTITLTVDGTPVDPANLVKAGDARNRTVGYTPPGPLGAGEHRYVFGAGDKAGNHATASGVFTMGPTARLSRLCGRERSEGMALSGDCRIEGTAVGGPYLLETSADGATWTAIAQSGGPVVDGLLGTWALAGLADGQRQVRLRVAAAGGELADAVSVVVDNTAPTVAIELVGGVADTAQPDLKGPVEIKGRAEDAYLARWTLEAGAGSSPTVWTPLGAGTQAAAAGTALASWNTAAGIDFDWTLRLTGEDGAGNKAVSTAFVHVDNTPPRVTLTSPAAGTTAAANGRLAVEGEVYDSRVESWALEYGAGSDPSSRAPIASGNSGVYQGTMATWDTIGLSAGAYTLRLTAKDRAGSETQVLRAVTLNAAPLARIAAVIPLLDGFVQGSVEVRGSVDFGTEGSYIVEASLDGTTWSPIGGGSVPASDAVLASWATNTVDDGAYTVRLVVTDSDDTTAGDQISVTVDNTAPVAAISAPAAGADIGGKVEILGTASDANLSSYTLEWGAGAAPTTWTGLGTFSPMAINDGLLAIWETRGLEVGAYTLRLRASDKAGSVTELLRAVQVTTDSIAPVVTLEAPADGAVTSAATVDVTGSVTDTALVSWDLTAQQFVDGSWSAGQTLASGTANTTGLLHAWDVSALGGRYRLMFTGTDTTGNTASASAEVILVHGAGYARIEGVGTLSMPLEPPLPPFAKGGIGQFVSGVVEVRGTAVAPALTSFVLEASPDDEIWSEVGTGTTAVTHGVLGTWDTSSLGDGNHHLRLRVLDAVAAAATDAANVPLDNLPPTVAITAPADGGLIGGYQYILGTAADAHFASYALDIAAATAPDLWWPIGGRSFAVTAGNLGTWVVNGDVGPFKQLFAVPGASDLLPYVIDLESTPDGRIFALDTYLNRIRVYDHQGQLLYSIGAGGELDYALGLFVKGDELFVANTGANNVLIYSLDGVLKATVPLSGLAADAPADLAVDNDGLIYFICKETSAIKVYTRAGEPVRTLSPTIDNLQVRYRSIDIDSAGDLYVSAPVLKKAVKLSPTGEYLQSFGQQNLASQGHLSSFLGGAQVDKAGNVYLADRQSGIVYQFDTAGSWIGAAGPFSIPDCFKVDDDGMLYIGMPFGMGFVALAPSTPVEAAALPEGSYTLRLSATDKAGHNAETTVAVAVERTLPEAQITSPISGAAVSGMVAISGRATDEHFARYELWRARPDQVRDPVSLTWSEVLQNPTMIGAAQTTALESGQLGTWDTAGLASGTYALLLRVYDAAGNMSEARADVSVGVPAETLTVVLTAPAANTALVAGGSVDVRGSIALSGGVLDHYEIGYGPGTAPQGWVEISRGYTAPGGTGTLCAWDTTGLAQGEYTLLVRAVSISGLEAEARVPVRVSAAPLLAVTSPAQGAAVAGVVEILGTVWDEDLAGYTLERGAGTSPTSWEQVAASSLPVVAGVIFRWDTAGLDGEYSFRLRATDAAGSESTLVRQVAADNTPPAASLMAETQTWNYGWMTSGEMFRADTLYLKGTATDDHFKSWRIEYGEGFAPTSWTILTAGSSPVSNVTFGSLSGSAVPWSIVTCALIVEDRAGNLSRASVTLRIVDVTGFATDLASSPWSVAVSPQGRLYVLDRAVFRVTILDPTTGSLIGRFGGIGTGDGFYTTPSDVATDDAGNVYVLEKAGRLQKFDADGSFLGSLPIRGNGLVVGADGTLYVTGKPAGEQYHVRVYDAAGGFIRGFGVDGNGPGLFSSGSAQKIARDRFGYLYVGNYDRGAEIFDPEGRFVMEMLFPIHHNSLQMNGIGVDENGNLAMALGHQRALWKTRLDGKPLWYGSIYPDAPGDLEISPWGIFVCAGKLWRFNEPQLDTVPESPEVRIESPVVGAMTDQDYVIVTGTAVAPGFTGYRLAWAPEADPEAFTEIMFSAAATRQGTLGFWRVAGLPNGDYRLRLTLQDDAGTTWTDETSITLGRALPLVAISSPAAGMLGSATVLLVYTVSDGTAAVWLDGQPVVKLSGDTLGPLSEGEHRVRVEAVDVAGNIGAAEVVFTVDTLPPEVAITAPAPGVVSIGTPVLVYAVSDGAVVVTLDGQAIAKVSGDALDPLPDGEHLVRVEAVDVAGNIGAAEVLFTVETAPPVVPGEMTLTLAVDAGGGTPIVGANAYLFSAAGAYLGAARVTDAAGQAAFTVEAGSYKIRCDYLGYQFWSTEVAVTADAGLSLSIPHRNVTIAVTGSYAGEQQLKSNVAVYLFTELGSYLSRSATTDADGHVSFSLPERGYKVRADYLSFPYWSGTLSGTSAAIAIPEAVAEVAVSRVAAPVAATPVYVFSAAGAYLGLSGTTDAAGRASFRLPAQGYRFRADHLGTQYFSAQVALQADQVNAISISTGGGTVSLSVGNGSAGAVAGVACYLFTDGGVYLNMSRTTDAAGEARFDLVDGSYKIRVDYLGAAFWTEPFTVPGAESLTLDLGGGTLRLSVDRGGGSPIVGASTYLFTATGTYLGISQVTDTLGEARFDVPAGTYQIRSDYLGYQFWSDAVAVSADAALALSIPQRQVTVSVLGDYAGSSEPRQNLPVHLFTSDGGYLGRTLASDANGQVRFELPERGYKLRVDDLSFPYWSEVVQGESATVTIPEALAEVAVTRAAQPLAGAPVFVFSTTGDYLDVSGITAANGVASFRLPAQAFRFRADNDGQQFFSADVALTAHQVNPVPLSLGGGTFTLSVVDGSGPLAGIPCYLFDDGETYLGASRVSDAAGAVSFDLPDGAYRIRADYLGYEFWSDPIAVPSLMADTLTIPRQEVAVTLRREYDGDARAIENASVYLFAPGGAYLDESRQTDGAGEANFTLPAQSFEVRADYLGRAYWSGPFVWSPQMLTIAEGLAEVTVTQAGSPLGGVLVSVFDDLETNLGIAQQTGPAGPASFRLPVGGYRFAADVQGSRFHGSGVVAADQVSQVELATGGGIFGLTVDDGDGAALGEVPVYVFTAAGVYLGMQQSTDAQGLVAFTLSDGEYLPRADYRGYQFWTTTQNVPAQTSALLSIPHGLARIHVTVAGADIAGAAVYLFDAAGSYLGVSVPTDSSGIAEFRLPGRGYSFRADYQGEQQWSQVVIVTERTVNDVEIDFLP